MTTDNKPSIAELQRIESGMSNGTWTVTPEPDMAAGLGRAGSRDSLLCIDRDGMACVDRREDAMGIATLRNAAPVLLEIAAAALVLGGELAYLQGPKSDRLKDALAKVRP